MSAMGIDRIIRYATAVGWAVLASCAAPSVKILHRPLPPSPAAGLVELEPATDRVLQRDGLSGLYRRDPVAALRELNRLQQESGDVERLTALAWLCGTLGEERAEKEPGFAAGCYLDAARLALPAALKMTNSGPEHELRLIYNESCAQLATLLQRSGHDWSQQARFDGPLTSHLLSLRTDGAGLVRTKVFDELLVADRIGLEHAKLERRRRDGIGGALVDHRPVGQIDASESPFVSAAGLVLPINATLEFPGSGDRAELALRDMIELGEVKVSGHQVPLAADWSSVLAYMYQYAPTAAAGFEAMIRPAEFDTKTDLFQLTPYHKDKIPLVFVHGLMSSPETWIQMMAALGSDPVIRENYQMLVFRYPSGYSIARNSAALRSRLAEFRKMADARGGGDTVRRMVLVGHSMGGILSNMQIRDSGERIRQLYFEEPLDQIDAPKETREKMRRLAVFQAETAVERTIYIAAPHRGSDLATKKIGDLGSWLIKLPSDIYKIGLSLTQLEELPSLTDLGKLTFHSRPDSIRGLRPDSKLLSTVLELPVAPRVTYHSIIGQAKQGAPLAEGTDEVVPYWSSHLDGAASELIVHATHTTITGNPEAIEEVRRLLYLHLGLPAPPPLPPAEGAGRDVRSVPRVLGHPGRR